MKRGCGSDADASSKRKAIAALRYELPYVSASALAAICKWCNTNEGLPDIRSRDPIRKVRDDVCFKHQTEYGKIHRVVTFATVKGDSVDVEMQNPWAFLQELFSTSSSMAHILGSLLKQRPNTFDNPWRLVVYSDEITPGNQVAHKNPRKTLAIYYSFLEFGSLWGSEEFWFTGTLVSSDTVRHIDGGWSSVIREFARMFWSPDGQDMERGGISIALCSESFSSSVRVHLFVKMGMMLSDEAALNAMLHSKGASGLKCCAICQNVCDAKSTRRSVHTDPWVALHTEPDASKFVMHTAGTINSVVKRLRGLASAVKDGEPCKGQLKDAQTNLGFSHNDFAILFDDFLRPKMLPHKIVCYDWMHVWCVSGILPAHAGRFFYYWHNHKNSDFKIEQAREYLALWTWPREIGDSHTGVKAFDSDRIENSLKAQYLHVTASEARSLIAPLGHFVRRSLINPDTDPPLRERAESFLHMVNVIEELEAASRGTCDVSRLRRETMEHMTSFIRHVGVGVPRINIIWE